MNSTIASKSSFLIFDCWVLKSNGLWKEIVKKAILEGFPLLMLFERRAVLCLLACKGPNDLTAFMSIDLGFFFFFWPEMAEAPTSPAGGSHDSGGEQSPRSSGVREQDRYLPIANISRIMKKALPANGKIAKDAKDTMQECVSEFISFITSEASDKCQKEKRKTINGDDLLWAMATLGFEEYIEPLKVYLVRYRELEGDSKGSARGGDASAKREAVGGLTVQNPQFGLQGPLNYINSQFADAEG